MRRSSKSNKASDRGMLRIWSETIAMWEDKAKLYCNHRHTWTQVPVDPEAYWSGARYTAGWRDGTAEEGYAFARRSFNLARRQVKINRRRLARSVKSYLKNYTGK
jgi:hypothetical protein